MRRVTVLHPLLLAVYPALFLFAHNADQLHPSVMLLPGGLCLLAAMALWLVMRLAFRDGAKAGLATSLVLVLFFSFEHGFHAARRLFGVRGVFSDHTFVVVIWAVILAAGCLLIIKSRNIAPLTAAVNVIAGVLVAMAAVTGMVGVLGQRRITMAAGITPVGKNMPNEAPPDIYYIVLDKYGRRDILDKVYRYDNGDALDFLRRRGFFVAERSFANYCQSYISLASSLNMDYLDEVAAAVGAASRDKTPLIELIRKNRVAAELKERGYLFVNFASGYEPSEVHSADVFVTPAGWSLSEYQNELVNMTPLALLLDRLEKKSQYDLHRRRILYTFDRLPDLAKNPRPTFVLAHVISPHPPFVFNADGSPINPRGRFSFQGREYSRRDYIKLYKNQLTFTNVKLKAMIDRILRESPQPPVIIIQADHGPGNMTVKSDVDLKKFNVRERMAIMNAYYLPRGRGADLLYDGISPVNSFRVVFNVFFGADLPLRPDRAYFSQYRTPYSFIDVTDIVNRPEKENERKSRNKPMP